MNQQYAAITEAQGQTNFAPSEREEVIQKLKDLDLQVQRNRKQEGSRDGIKQSKETIRFDFQGIVKPVKVLQTSGKIPVKEEVLSPNAEKTGVRDIDELINIQDADDRSNFGLEWSGDVAKQEESNGLPAFEALENFDGSDSYEELEDFDIPDSYEELEDFDIPDSYGELENFDIPDSYGESEDFGNPDNYGESDAFREIEKNDRADDVEDDIIGASWKSAEVKSVYDVDSVIQLMLNRSENPSPYNLLIDYTEEVAAVIDGELYVNEGATLNLLEKAEAAKAAGRMHEAAKLWEGICFYSIDAGYMNVAFWNLVYQIYKSDIDKTKVLLETMNKKEKRLLKLLQEIIEKERC